MRDALFPTHDIGYLLTDVGCAIFACNHFLLSIEPITLNVHSSMPTSAYVHGIQKPVSLQESFVGTSNTVHHRILSPTP